MTIGKRLREYRERYGLERQDVAAVLHVDRAYIVAAEAEPFLLTSRLEDQIETFMQHNHHCRIGRRIRGSWQDQETRRVT